MEYIPKLGCDVFQVGFIFTEAFDIDKGNLKAIVRNATSRGVQVVVSIRVCCYFFLKKTRGFTRYCATIVSIFMRTSS